MKTEEGFTFIEVILVLAIAGLIFSMTFIALPALWASQRDTDRREDVLGFISTLQKYQSNNSRGALPGTNSELSTLSNDNGTLKVTFNDAGVMTEPAGTINETSWAGFYNGYFDKDTFIDPDGPRYNWLIMTCNRGASDGNGHNSCSNKQLSDFYSGSFKSDDDYKYTMLIVTSATCYGGEAVYSNNVRRVAALYRLEGGGVYCENT